MKKFIYIAALAFLCGPSAYAQEKNPEVFASISDIPDSLRKLPRNGYEYPEQYVGEIISIIRRYGRDKNALDLEDVEALKEMILNDSRRRQVKSFISFDLNFDGKITREEIVNYFLRSGAYQRDKNQHDLEVETSMKMLADGNGDNTITIPEIADYAVKTANTADNEDLNKVKNLLTLDSNADGRITVEEVEILARKAFQTIDSDGNGMLSKSENDAVFKVNLEKLNASRSEEHGREPVGR